jgi:hypothetical protein
MCDAIDAQNNDDVDDEYDTLLDMLDLLTHEEASAEMELAVAKFAERILDFVADLSETESALLVAAIQQKTTPQGLASALAAFSLLHLRVLGRAPDN